MTDAKELPANGPEATASIRTNTDFRSLFNSSKNCKHYRIKYKINNQKCYNNQVF